MDLLGWIRKWTEISWEMLKFSRLSREEQNKVALEDFKRLSDKDQEELLIKIRAMAARQKAKKARASKDNDQPE